MLSSPRVNGERGSALLLVPAGIFIVLVLGAIAVDLSLVHLARQDAADVAAAIADDTVTAALDQDAARNRGEYRVDERLVGRVADEVLRARGAEDRVVDVQTGVDGDTVTVEVTERVRYVFARGVPGAADGTTVTARASAVLRRR